MHYLQVRPRQAQVSPPRGLHHFPVGRRHNTTAQYLSWKTAKETGCWESNPRKQAAHPACAKKITALGDDWPEFQARVNEWYAVSEASCRAMGKPVTFLSMEDYLAPQWQTYEQEVAQLRLRELPRSGS